MNTAPEIWYKAQRALRTLVQVGIPAFLAFALVLPQIIEALGLPVDSKLRLWLVAVAAGVTAVATAIARVMAIPAVNAWLIRIGLGSVPASAVRTDQAGTFVKRDPKVTGEGIDLTSNGQIKELIRSEIAAHEAERTARNIEEAAQIRARVREAQRDAPTDPQKLREATEANLRRVGEAIDETLSLRVPVDESRDEV